MVYSYIIDKAWGEAEGINACMADGFSWDTHLTRRLLKSQGQMNELIGFYQFLSYHSPFCPPFSPFLITQSFIHFCLPQRVGTAEITVLEPDDMCQNPFWLCHLLAPAACTNSFVSFSLRVLRYKMEQEQLYSLLQWDFYKGNIVHI